MLYGTVPELVTGAAAGNCQDTVGEPVRSGRNRWFVDSPLERAGFELLVRGRGEAGCRAFDAPSYLGRVGSRRSDPATTIGDSREQIPIAVSELADQYLMRRVTRAPSSSPSHP